MDTMKFEAIFEYTNFKKYKTLKLLEKPIKAAMENLFVTAWNYMAKDSENNFKKWNAEYGKIISQDDYEKFITKKMQAYLDERVNNKIAQPLMCFKADTVDAGNVIGYLVDHPDVTISMYLKPM